MMRLTGLEPALLSELEPKSNVYANFTTGAYAIVVCDTFHMIQTNGSIIHKKKFFVKCLRHKNWYSLLPVVKATVSEEYL